MKLGSSTLLLALAVWLVCCMQQTVWAKTVQPSRLLAGKRWTAKNAVVMSSGRVADECAANESPISALHTQKLFQVRGGSGEGLDWRYFVAGAFCAGFSHGITTPLDVVKTRMQTYPERYTTGVVNAAKAIVASEGMGFLLAGLGPTVVGYGFEGALKFGCYETFKKLFANVTASQFVNYLLASVVAGAVASIVLVPMEEARIKMVGDASWAKENTVTAIGRLVHEKGLIASFGGLPAMLSKQIPYTMGKQVSFDVISATVSTVIHRLVSEHNANSKLLISIISAFLASIVACVFSQPGDMILTAASQNEHLGFAQLVQNIYGKHGLQGFFLGIQARLAHVASIITVQLVVYDLVKGALGLPVTGSH